jgi:hypothetical protein
MTPRNNVAMTVMTMVGVGGGGPLNAGDRSSKLFSKGVDV